jgi:hypothetical protein
MKERYDDRRYYRMSDGQDPAPIVICNYRRVVDNATYAGYVQRFRALAEVQSLRKDQRPKLPEDEFSRLRGEVLAVLQRADEKELLDSERACKILDRLLLMDALEEDVLE